MTTTDSFELQAPAKINLTLEILGRRPDGYHNIASVMQAVSLYDTLTFEHAPGGELVLDCADPALAGRSQDNLVWRAARLVQQARGVTGGVRITLEKGIPVAAGLGGGSSDAAATLRGLDRLWNLGLQPRELQNLASLLGSDVAFFLHGGTALAEGRGEQVTPLRPLTAGWFVLVTPPLATSDKTRLVYNLLRPYEHTNGVLTRRLVDLLAAGAVPPTTMLYNGLEDAVFRAFDALDDVRRAVVAAGGESVRVTGAGPSLFVYCPTEDAARAIATALAADAVPVHVAQPVAGSDV
jgi:4-diphosphocytidyl-2-C-methyl-D-erythritol kinase